MFGVGFKQGRADDRERLNWNGDAARPLIWSVWYPAAKGGNVRSPAPGHEQLFVSGRAIRDVDLSGTRQEYPVVLLSHGTGGTAASLAWLSEGLAENGFVVIGVDHHGNTGSEPYRAEGFLCWWERARDLSVILDRIANGPFACRLDLNRVYAAGFSLGGYTVLALLGGITEMPLFLNWAKDTPLGNGPREFPDIARQVETLMRTSAVFRASWERQSLSYLDTRIKAALLCAPAPTIRGMTADSLARITAPVAIAAVGADREAPSDLCAEWLNDLLPSGAFHLLHQNAGHYAFLCECTDWGRQNAPDICADVEGVERALIHKKVVDLAVAQFAQ